MESVPSVYEHIHRLAGADWSIETIEFASGTVSYVVRISSPKLNLAVHVTVEELPVIVTKLEDIVKELRKCLAYPQAVSTITVDPEQQEEEPE